MTSSIKAAFNLGVLMRRNEPAKDVFEAGRTLKETIYLNLRRPDEGTCPQQVIDANVNYLTDIAILGFLMSGVCSYDPEIKERIPQLIENKLVSDNYLDEPGDYEGDVAEKEEKLYYAKLKAIGMN
ncbi:MAG: hypothetical protein ACHQ6U_08990 [Thermodesulfobacteriota bacterium]